MINPRFDAGLNAASAALRQVSEAVDDRISAEVDVMHLRDRILEAEKSRIDIVDTLNWLDTALSSLEACGYSQEWYNLINTDGSFAECTGLRVTELVGSDEKKFEACCEGILDAIWSFLKMLWNWICDALHKIVEFMRKLISCFKGTDDFGRIVSNLCTAAATNGKLTPLTLNEKLQAINDLGDGKQFFDIFEVVERAGLDLCACAWIGEKGIAVSNQTLTNMRNLLEAVNRVSGHIDFKTTNNLNALSDQFAQFVGCVNREEMIDNLNHNTRENFILGRFQALVAGRDSRVGIRTFPCNTGKNSFKDAYITDLKRILNKNKYGIVNDATGARIEVSAFDDTVEQVDYTTKIKTVDGFVRMIDTILTAMSNMRKLAEIARNAHDTLADCSETMKKNLPKLQDRCDHHCRALGEGAKPWKDCMTILRESSRQISEALSTCAKLLTDSNKCRTTVGRFMDGVNQVMKD